MQNREVFRPWVVVLSLMIILGIFAARCLQTARAYSITTDEDYYVSSSLHFWMTGDDLGMWQAGVPRLPHLINTSVPYLVLRQAGLPPVPSPEPTGFLWGLLTDDKNTVILPVRRMAIGWGILALLVTYWAVARTCGAALGLVAAALLSMVPEMLAHSSRAGPDVPCATAMFIALLTLARYVERPSLFRWVAMALAIGLAWAMRHNAILLIPLAVGASLWVAFRQPRPSGVFAIGKRLGGTACSSVALVAIAFAVLWASDGLKTIPLGSEDNPARRLRTIRNLGPLDVSRLPLPTSLLSLRYQLAHAMYGHPAYFCGELDNGGWMLYFPVAFLLKTPIGLLILIILATVRVRPRGALDWILLGCLVLLWIALVRNKIDTGLRYALLTYALIMPFIARLFEKSLLRDRIWGPITIAATLFLVWESVICHPQYLSSFNQLGGGSRVGWLYLADSNLDAGQDIDALVAELKKLGIEEITTTGMWGWRTLALAGIRAMLADEKSHNDLVKGPTPPSRRLHYTDGSYQTIRTRYIAVGVNSMLGLKMVGFDKLSVYELRWLWTRRLVKRVNDSILIFDMDRPAETPFFL